MFGRNRWEMPGVGLTMGLVLAGLLLSVPRGAAQDTSPQKTVAGDPAPVPEQLRTARRVFIGNAGVDGVSIKAFEEAGDISQPYHRFYAAMKSWGRYQLVGTPADADLAMEVRFSAPMTDCGKVTSYTPYMELSVLDAKTHFQLWSITVRVNGAWRKSTWDKNVDKGAVSLVENLKKLSGDAAAGGSPPK